MILSVIILPDTVAAHHVCDDVTVIPEDIVPALDDVTVTDDEPPAETMDTLVGLNAYTTLFWTIEQVPRLPLTPTSVIVALKSASVFKKLDFIFTENVPVVLGSAMVSVVLFDVT